MKTVLLMLVVGLLQLGAYFVAERSVTPDGGYPITQGDVGCYLQAAQRILEGHPFSYARDLPPSTGTTSVLYPFVLAAPIALFGLHGASAIAVSFWMNALFYLVFLAAWGVVIARLFRPGAARLAAALLIALSGHAAGVAFAQCDIGFFMALTALFAACATTGHRTSALALLTLSPWVRPEGMMLTMAVVFVVVCTLLSARARELLVRARPQARQVALLALPVLSCAGVFALNLALTGEAMFSSVAEKGYFKEMSAFSATLATFEDLAAILLSYLCSVPTMSTRFFSMPSPLASICFWIGVGTLLVALRRRATAAADTSTSARLPLVALALAMLMALVSIAEGSCAGIQYDRYLGWMVPLPAIVSAVGFGWVWSRLERPRLRRVVLVVCLAATLFSTVASPFLVRRVAQSMHGIYLAHRASNAALEGDPKIGSYYFSTAFAYENRRWVNLCGIYTRAYRACSNLLRVGDFLKWNPDQRFDVWALDLEQNARYRPSPAELEMWYGKLVPGGNAYTQARLADWTPYDRAMETPLAPEGFSLVDAFDIGYAADERKHAFTLAEDLEVAPLCEVAAPRQSDGLAIVESGRQCQSTFSFALRTRPRTDAVLVLRTIGRIRDDSGRELTFSAEPTLWVSVADGRAERPVRVEMPRRTFADVAIPLDGQMISSTETRVNLRGNYAAFGFWLFQKGSEIL